MEKFITPLHHLNREISIYDIDAKNTIKIKNMWITVTFSIWIWYWSSHLASSAWYSHDHVTLEIFLCNEIVLEFLTMFEMKLFCIIDSVLSTLCQQKSFPTHTKIQFNPNNESLTLKRNWTRKSHRCRKVFLVFAFCFSLFIFQRFLISYKGSQMNR